MFLTTECTKDDTEKERKEALIQDMLDEISADSLEADVTWFQDMGTRFTLTDNHRSVAVKIRNRFRSIGYPEARLDSFFVTKTYRNIEYKQLQYNVIATITGSEYPDSLCILGGHYDNIILTGDPFTVVPGANDNASGVAAALEIARVMNKYNFRPRNSIMFIAFGAEEIGLFGSLDFAADPDGFFRKISFMLNNDMIAYEPGTDPGLWRVNILDYDNSHRLRRDAEQISLKYVMLSYKNDNTSNKYSDSYPFFRYGYKALFFFSDIVDPNLHTLNDLLSNCNFDYCREIVRLNCALLADKN
jgi:leucyl aminopeptidase